MAEFNSDNIRLNGLNYAKNNVSRVLQVVGEPTTYANVTTAFGTGSGQLAVAHPVDSEDFNAVGISGGQSMVCDAQTGATAEGTIEGVNYWVWVDDENDSIEAYGPISPTVAVTASGPSAIGATALRMPAAVAYMP